MILLIYLLTPSFSHSSVVNLPDTKICCPLWTYSPIISANLRQATHLTHSVFSFFPPDLSFQDSETAMEKLAMAVPSCVYLISGSLPTLPIKLHWFKSDILSPYIAFNFLTKIVSS